MNPLTGPTYTTRIEEVLWGCGLIALTLVIHAYGMILALRFSQEFKERFERKPTFSRGMMNLVLTTWIISFVHVTEVMVWAAFFQWKHCFPNFSTANYFTFLEYTTVGSSLNLPVEWRLLEGMVATAGLHGGHRRAARFRVVHRGSLDRGAGLSGATAADHQATTREPPDRPRRFRTFESWEGDGRVKFTKRFLEDDLVGVHFALNVFIATTLLWLVLHLAANLNPIWAISSMIAASDPVIKQAAKTFRGRLINAFLGCTIGMLFLIVGGAQEWKLPLALAVTVLLSTYVVRVQVMWRQAPITAAIVIAAGMTHQSEITALEIGVRRVGEVLLGCVVGLAVSWTMSKLWPIRESTPPSQAGKTG